MDHADLTDEYATIPSDMKAVAGFFGKEFLREVDENEFMAISKTFVRNLIMTEQYFVQSISLMITNVHRKKLRL